MQRILAIFDLLKRYEAVFRSAWHIRGELRGVSRQPHELAFLPANLELAETPVHPAPLWAMRSVVLLAMVILLIVVFGRLDIVVVAKGKLSPNSQVKLIQPAVTGVVRSIQVNDGQKVRAGELLLELDPVQARADDEKAHAAKLAAALAIARARSLLGSLISEQPPLMPPVAEASIADLRESQALADGFFREHIDKKKQLEAELSKREAELQETRHDIDRLTETAPLTRKQAEDYKALANDKYVATHDYIDRERTAIEQEHDLAAKRSHADQLSASIIQGKAEIAGLASQFRREQLDAIDKASQQFEQNRDEELKAETRQKLMSLVAPVDGTVQQLNVHTLGGVVTTAQTLMEIVPDETLEAAVSIENKDIGFILPGQKAVIKVEAFPYTRFGTLSGRVLQVANDALQDKRQGLNFSARVQLPTGRMKVNGQWISLTPGMAVSAEIKTGKRSVAEYFLDPLLRDTQESLRER